MGPVTAKEKNVKLDHFGLFSHNFYKSTFELCRETGLGNYDSGFFPNFGNAAKNVALGPDVYLEIEGLVDYTVIKRIVESEAGASEPHVMAFIRKLLAKPEVFFLWAFRAESLAELNEIARVAGWAVDHDTLNQANAQQRMNGDNYPTVSTPKGGEQFASSPGMPNVYLYPHDPDRSKQDLRALVIPETSKKKPTGVAWLEVGGTEKQFEDWFGGFAKARDFPLQFNGKAPGLYTLAVNTDGGEVVIRRPAINS